MATIFPLDVTDLNTRDSGVEAYMFLLPHKTPELQGNGLKAVNWHH